MALALNLDPDSWEVNKEAGRLALNRRNIRQATLHYEKAVEMMDSDFHAWAMLATCYQAQGEKAKLREAAKMMVSEADRTLQQDPSNGAALGILAGGHAILGEDERAREWIERAILIDPDNLTMRYNFACVLAAHLRDADGALSLLERTLATASEYHVRIAMCDPDLDLIREDPRFQNLVAQAKKRVGIEAAAPTAASAATHK